MIIEGTTTSEATVSSPPTNRWTRDQGTAARGAADRVKRSHAQTRVTARLALAFVAASAVAWALGGGEWLPLHLFLAGGVVLAISGVSLMLTVTWSAAPAPPNAAVMIQRISIAGGAAGVAAGRELELGSAVMAPAGVTYVVGLGLLAVLLGVTIRRGVERRFDAAVAAYVAALAAGMTGVALGVTMAVRTASTPLRAAHVTLNLLGLVGLVIGGTLPFFAATVGRSRMAPHASGRRLMAVVGWQATALAVAVLGLAAEARVLATAGLGAYAAGIGAVLWLLPRPTRRQLRWAGPRLIALWMGSLWWIGVVVATAVVVADGDGVAFGDRSVQVLVVAGYAQILWGSLAYLLPMLRGGGHERLGQGFAATRSWIGLGAANAAGFALAMSAPRVAGIAIAVWVLDAGFRAARVGFGAPGRARATSKEGRS